MQQRKIKKLYVQSLNIWETNNIRIIDFNQMSGKREDRSFMILLSNKVTEEEGSSYNAKKLDILRKIIIVCGFNWEYDMQ